MKHHLKQLIPSETCLACDVCCRYPDKQSLMAPVFSREEQQKAVEWGLSKQSFPSPEPDRGTRIRVTDGESCYRCPAFAPATHECAIYPERPFDCQLYPFTLMFNPNKSKIHLVMDPLCPFIQTHHNPLSPSGGEGKHALSGLVLSEVEGVEGGEGENLLKAYGIYLYDYLSQSDVIQWVCQNQNLVSEYQDSMIPVCDLEKLTKSLVPKFIQQGLTPLTSQDFDRFQTAFAKKLPALSCEHFLSHYLWSDSLRYYWTEINGYLCLFAEAGNHIFMPVPPIGNKMDSTTMKECFELMNFWNQNRSVSRISGMRQEDAALFSDRYRVTPVENEYLYDRLELAELHGTRYKSKRSGYNRFLKEHPDAIYRPFEAKDASACLRLYQAWLDQYQRRPLPSHQIEMARENYSVHQKGVLEYSKLGLTGRIVETDGIIAGYTFGIGLNAETFYVLFEITDVKVRGISQYLFREFCRELEKYRYIHAGGDSGLPSLKKVKESYRPIAKHAIYQIAS